MMERLSTVLPEPDSPTTPRVRPRAKVSETPSTARTSPRPVRNEVCRSIDLEERALDRPHVGEAQLRASPAAAHRFTSRRSKYERRRSAIRLRAVRSKKM